VDLRGLRVDEVEPALLPAIDAAIVADLPALRIIHGKGTGAVRAEVKALLEGDERIPNHRPGGPGEGGEGVTVIEFASRRESGNG
jgi:DNA mismatch repair protein MutS2